MRIIDRLDTTTAGNVIFRGSHFQESIVPQRTRSLHQSFAERPLSDQHGTVEILQRSRHDLGGRGRHTIHQHGDRNLRIERFGLRHERRVGRFRAAVHRHDFGAFGHEHRKNLHGFLQNAAAIAPQVDDQRSDPLFFQFLESGPHIVAAILREIVVQDITHIAVDHAVIRDP